MQTVLLTGAGGAVGTMITPLLRAVYPSLVLSDRTAIAHSQDLPFRTADLTDMAAVQAAVAGVHGIIHLGGFSVEGPWQTILDANIVGCYNLFEAARLAGVTRIVFASSNHAVGFYPREEIIPAEAPPLPDSRYGVSKAFGEALGALYAMKHGIGVVSLRIGHVAVRPPDVRRLSNMLHPEDLLQLIRIGLEHPDIVNEIFYGVSANTRTFYDNARAEKFGYRPAHNAESKAAFAEKAQRAIAPDAVGDVFQGGSFCSADYSADLGSIMDKLDRTMDFSG